MTESTQEQYRGDSKTPEQRRYGVIDAGVTNLRSAFGKSKPEAGTDVSKNWFVPKINYQAPAIDIERAESNELKKSNSSLINIDMLQREASRMASESSQVKKELEPIL
jgi:hypothetical protein